MLQAGIRIGELDRQITFIEKSLRESVTNEDFIESWTSISTYPIVWAKKKELPGNEILQADRLTYVQRTVFTIRYREDISVMMRCVADNKVYEIISITEPFSQRKKFLEVMANLLDNEPSPLNQNSFSLGFSIGFTA